jgi:hypothetical protein
MEDRPYIPIAMQLGRMGIPIERVIRIRIPEVPFEVQHAYFRLVPNFIQRIQPLWLNNYLRRLFVRAYPFLVNVERQNERVRQLENFEFAARMVREIARYTT